MVRQRHQKLLLYIAFAIGCLFVPGAVTYAQQSQSTSYQVNEVFFGTGGELEACSTSYCSKQSAGELGVGSTSSTNYTAQAGFNTDRTPYIEAALVGSGNIDMGTLKETETRTGTAQFKVSAYLSSGYIVQVVGTTPTNSGHALTAMTGTTSTIGTEQFGMNLVANNVATATPSTTFGADPVQDPDYPAQPFGFGTVVTGYDTANTFKYNSGDTVATSTKSTSYTVYTLSYIANISGVTPGGTYTTNQSIVATATF